MTVPKHQDDELHPPGTDDPWIIETAWFSFMEPARRMAGTVYLACRPNLDVCSLHVNVFDATAYEPWRVPYWRSLWQLPMPSSLNPCELKEAGLRIDVLQPLWKYRIQYGDVPELELDLIFEGLRDSHMRGDSHLDQPGHVTGTLKLQGKPMAIDCFQMRDRTWATRRSDLEGNRGGYTYGIGGAESGFQTYSRGEGASALTTPAGDIRSNTPLSGDDHDIQPILAGYLLREGRLDTLVSGERRVVARGGAGEPLGIDLKATDDQGRFFEAEGSCESRMLLTVNGGMLAWDSLVKWSFDGGVCWGEDQDIWTPRLWRAFKNRKKD